MTAYPRFQGDVISPWIVRMLTGFAKREHRVSVFTSSYRGLGNQVMNGVKIYRFRYAPKNLEILTHDMAVPERMKQGMKFKLLVIPYLASGFIHSLTFPVEHDIVHVHWPIPHIIFGLPMKYRWKVPLLLYVHGGELNFLNKLPGFMKQIFISLMKKADTITVNSSYTKNLVESYRLNIPVEIIPFGNPHGETRLHPYQKKDRNVILFVGRLIEVKGLEDLIRAFKIVREKYEDAELRVVGDGPLKENLLKLAKELDVPVTFTGYKTGEELESEYLNATVFVLPSKPDKIGQTETLGVVTIEALSYGVPVVASNIGGIPDVIKDGKTGLLFKPGDFHDLADKIITLLDNPPLREKLVREGQMHIRTNYSWDRIVERLEKIYLRLLRRDKKTHKSRMN